MSTGNPPGDGGKKPPVRKVIPVPKSVELPSVVPEAGPRESGAFAFGQLAPREEVAARRRRPGRPIHPGLLIGGGLGLLCVVLGIVVSQMSGGKKSALAIKSIPTQEVDELTDLQLTVAVEGAESAKGKLKYSLRNAPQGAQIDPKTGRLTWTPTEKQGPGEYKIIVQVADSGADGAAAERQFTVRVGEVSQPPVIAPIEERAVDSGRNVEIAVKAHDPDDPPQSLRYRLVGTVAAGARIDPKTGQFQWTAQDASPGDAAKFVVQVEKTAHGGLSAKREFSIRVAGAASPVDRLVADLRARGATVDRSAGSVPSPLTGKCQALAVDGELIGAFEYATDAEADRNARQVTDDAVAKFGTGVDGRPLGRLFQTGRLVVFCAAKSETLRQHLAAVAGQPLVLARAEKPVPKPLDDKPAGPKPKPEGPPDDPAQKSDEAILALYESGKSLNRKEYPTLRKIYADRFEAQHADQIKQAYAGDHEKMSQWLGEHADIKEELYTAIDPKLDNVLRSLQLFHELKTKFPDAIGPFAELAIAVAVTWDNERGVYDYRGHQTRTRSKMPEGQLAAIENFQYVVGADKVTQMYGQLLPWEFLVHVVNHTTPLAERQWAVAGYGGRRIMYGKCYQDVPYDTQMLNTNGKTVKLDGKDYTLANLRQLGGVCAMQADYAARVGKSMGIPAEYVHGESSFGELHAWVMWVDLKAPPSRGSILFSLESHGRYRGDHYYVGGLQDPKTGQPTTDRQLELRLQTVGYSPVAKRQADLIMAAYPMLRDKTQMDVTGQLMFLNKVIDLSPGNEAAWIALAKMSREGVVTKEHHKAMQLTLRKVFTVFRNCPDFTWQIFDDLVSYMDVPKQRNKLYGELVMLYVNGNRPDLACEAILKYTDYLVKERQQKDAMAILQNTILKFHDEGRYVPKMLDRLEQIDAESQGKGQELLAFYQALLPTIAKKRDDRPSPYCMNMYKRGIERFRKGGQEQAARYWEAQLAALGAVKAQ
jgi:hypothetical protein